MSFETPFTNPHKFCETQIHKYPSKQKLQLFNRIVTVQISRFMIFILKV
jgi:hypothetical protein